MRMPLFPDNLVLPFNSFFPLLGNMPTSSFADSSKNNRLYWEARAKQLRRQLNLGLAWDFLVSRLVGLSAIGAIVIFAGRLLGLPVAVLLIPLALALLLVIGFGGRALRTRWFSFRDALALIDVRLQLDCHLTAAADGVVGWPDPESCPCPRRFFHWDARRTAAPTGLIALLLTMAFILPTPQRAAPEEHVRTPPPAWAEVATWIEELQEEEAFDSETLTSLEETLQRLLDRNPEDWFSHESLEAGDMLRDRTRDAMREMAALLHETTRFLDLAAHPDLLPEDQIPRFQEQWLEHLEDLASSRLPLDQDLLDRLASVDFANLPELSPEMLEDLRERMECAGGACSGGLEPGDMFGQNGESPNGAGLQAWMEGRGGIGEGPGPSPLTFSEQTSPRLEDGSSESLHNPDSQHIAPGEYLGAGTATIPEEEITPWTGPSASGGASPHQPRGGDLIWTQTLTPSEQEFLQRYFD